MSATTAGDELYRDLILSRARAPRHGTLLACYDAEAEGDNPMCGDRLTLRLRRDEAGRIEAVGFEGRGCAISLASADLMSECVIGLDRAEAGALGARFAAMVRTGEIPDDPAFDVLGAFRGVHAYRARSRCATLPWTALAAGLAIPEPESQPDAASGRPSGVPSVG